MKRQGISYSELRVPVYRSWSEEGFLLTCGDHAAGKFNTMTVGWGSLGCMWKRPMAMVVVRPHRYTYQFMEEYSDFTISHFPSPSPQRPKSLPFTILLMVLIRLN